MTRLLRLFVCCLALGGGARAAAAGWEEAKKAFETALKNPDWKERKDAFIRLSDHDRPEAVSAILDAIAKETNPAVVLSALDTLGSYGSAGARAEVVAAAKKGSGTKRLHALFALQKQTGPEVDALLLDVAKSGDGPAVAQAALALGRKERQGAVPVLTALLADGDWQVRAAAARSLVSHGAKDAVPALAAALATAKGRDRFDIVQALKVLTGQDFGQDPPAWKAFAGGADPASIARAPQEVPTIFGVPITGQRVVVLLDNSLRTTEGHPFDKDRLMALCSPPDGKPIAWFRLVRMADFMKAHLRHLADGLPKNAKLEVLTFNATVNPVFGKLTPSTAGTRKTLEDTLEALQPDDGIATYPVLTQALDIGGPADSSAWRNGVDEIVFVTVNQPTAGEITDADVVAAAIGLRARLRMVPIHTVGIHTHPYDMCRAIAERTGGVYVDLTQ